MEDIIETLEYKGYKINIKQDEGFDPRTEYDNLSKMICFSKRYSLGDDHDYNHSDYNGWDEMERAIIRNEDVAIIKPLYMYDHSGITISTSSFDCRWDSGQIGFVYISKKDIRENYSIKRVTQKWIDNAEKILDSEVETYDQYLRGECYGYEVVRVDTNEVDGETEEIEVELDSCWGFIGSDHKESGLLEYAHNAIDCDIKNNEKVEEESNEA
jgi:hypothetical protein